MKIEQRDADSDRRAEWRPGRLAGSGPNDPVYELDTAGERVTFGNGVNGHIPPAGATMLASYAVCDGEQGGVAAQSQMACARFRRLVRRECRRGDRRSRAYVGR